MIHLRAIDPDSTWTHELPGGLRLRCRFLTVRKLLRYRELRESALGGTNDVVIVESLLDAINLVVVDCRHESGEQSPPAALLDMLTLNELWDLSHELAIRQSLAEADLGKSESARPTAAAPCAVNAGVASA